ncbi:MAG: chitosanase [Pyrinomonadaceae bacterium]
MSYTETDKVKALAIVHVFETSRPFGDYAACVVLNDGAGVSYGINQFTHRSGSLLAVVDAYLASGSPVGRDALAAARSQLALVSAQSISRLASNETFKKALRRAAVTREMRDAQNAVMFTRYLAPALGECTRRGLRCALSLAVVYDSITHGSWERLSRAIDLHVGRVHFEERAWITAYVRRRHLWLTNVRRLKSTNYRTRFFLEQIMTGNWSLRPPMRVHGVALTEAMFAQRSADTLVRNVGSSGVGADGSAAIPARTRSKDAADDDTNRSSSGLPIGATPEEPSLRTGVSALRWGRLPALPSGALESVGERVSSAARRFDQVEGVVTAVTTRRDAAKSLWTTIVGTIWQAAWAVFGFVIGLPRSIWIGVAMIAAVLMLVYLYRQISLGRVRELRNVEAPRA